MTPRGEPLSGFNNFTYCSFNLNHANTDLVEFLHSFSDKLYAHNSYLERLRSTGGLLEYFVGMYVDKNAGIVVDMPLLNKLVDLGIQLSLDLYKGTRKKK